jgi:hypothetical protein
MRQIKIGNTYYRELGYNPEKKNDGSLDRECRTCDRGINGYNVHNDGYEHCMICRMAIDREIK